MASSKEKPLPKPSQTAFLNGLIKSLINTSRMPDNKMKSSEQLESEFCAALNSPILFARYRTSLITGYVQYLKDKETAELQAHKAKLMETSCVRIQRYQELLEKSLFCDSSSIGYIGNLRKFVGEIPPKTYVLLYLFVASSGLRRYNSDGLISVCLSGASSLGKSKVHQERERDRDIKT